MNREEWLTSAINELRPLFVEAGAELPEASKIRVSCGWPSRGGVAPTPRGSVSVGQTWSTEATMDNSTQIFISPRVSNGVKILGILVHELIHTWDDNKHGHRSAFKRVAVKIGLEGKMTATEPSADLTAKLEPIATKLGDYPNAEVNVTYKPKVQDTRMIKLECLECGYLVRTSRRWIAIGKPTCPCGKLFEADESDLQV